MNTIKILSFLCIVILGLTTVTQAANALILTVQDKNNKSTKEVLVTLTPLSGTPTNVPTSAATQITQRDYMFEPRMAVVEKGGQISFPNYDNAHHHVYSFSEAKTFEFPLYKGESPAVSLENEGIIAIGCNIHDWMMAYIAVVDTPYYGITDENGIVNFATVPKGEYTLSYWHPSLDPEAGLQKAQTLNVTDTNTSLNLKFDITSNILWPKKPDFASKKAY